MSKFKYPFTSSHNFSSFEEAKKAALTFDEIKKRVDAGRKVKMFMVTALAPYASIEVVFTDKDLINNYEYSDIGRQIGFMATLSNHSVYKSRSFTGDIGLDEDPYNRHLVFSSKVEAEAYIRFVKTSVDLIIENHIHQEECDFLFDYIDNNCYDNYYDTWVEDDIY